MVVACVTCRSPFGYRKGNIKCTINLHFVMLNSKLRFECQSISKRFNPLLENKREICTNASVDSMYSVSLLQNVNSSFQLDIDMILQLCTVCLLVASNLFRQNEASHSIVTREHTIRTSYHSSNPSSDPMELVTQPQKYRIPESDWWESVAEKVDERAVKKREKKNWNQTNCQAYEWEPKEMLGEISKLNYVYKTLNQSKCKHPYPFTICSIHSMNGN